MDNQSIPSFFIIGVQKSGTSSIHTILYQDERISLPYRKETHFFSTNFSKNINWYLNMFINKKYQIRGEIDPSYIHYPISLLNIKKYNPNPKIILVFRKPIERAYSHYIMSKNRNYETLSFNEALNMESERLRNDNDNFSFSNHSYMLRGNYYEQIKRCKKIFSDSNYLYIKFDDILNIDSREFVIKKIYKFLNINYKFNLNCDIHKNQATIHRLKFIRDLLYSDSIIRRFLKFIIRSQFYRYRIIRTIERLNSKRILDNTQNLDFSSLDKKFIYWNNAQSEMLSEETNICTQNWIIK